MAVHVKAGQIVGDGEGLNLAVQKRFAQGENDLLAQHCGLVELGGGKRILPAGGDDHQSNEYFMHDQGDHHDGNGRV